MNLNTMVLLIGLLILVTAQASAKTVYVHVVDGNDNGSASEEVRTEESRLDEAHEKPSEPVDDYDDFDSEPLSLAEELAEEAERGVSHEDTNERYERIKQGEIHIAELQKMSMAQLIDEARKQADRGIAGSMEGHAAMDMSVQAQGSFLRRLFSPQGLTAVSHIYVMEWAAILRDIILGLLIAGAGAAWVPETFWQS